MVGGWYIHRGCSSFNFWGLTLVMFVEGMNINCWEDNFASYKMAEWLYVCTT